MGKPQTTGGSYYSKPLGARNIHPLYLCTYLLYNNIHINLIIPPNLQRGPPHPGGREEAEEGLNRSQWPRSLSAKSAVTDIPNKKTLRLASTHKNKRYRDGGQSSPIPLTKQNQPNKNITPRIIGFIIYRHSR